MRLAKLFDQQRLSEMLESILKLEKPIDFVLVTIKLQYNLSTCLDVGIIRDVT